MLVRALVVGLVATGLTSCAGMGTYDEGERMLATGDTEQGLAQLERAMRAHPDNPKYRQRYERERNIVVTRYVSEADLLRGSQQWDAAAAGYRRALGLDPDNARAKAGLESIETARKQSEIIAQARKEVAEGRLDDAEKVMRALLAQNPGQRDARDLLNEISDRKAELQAQATPTRLKSQFTQPITLEFRDASLKSVFEVISRSAGINFVFDRDVRSDTKINIFVRDTSLEDVIRLILVTNQLERKLLNDNTVLIYPNTPAKQKEYKELVVRSFYLANGDVKQALNLVKGMVKTPDVFIDEKLNLMVVKDSPEAVRTIANLLRSMDLAEPEVMLEIEVLELASSKLRDLGINYPESVNLGSAAAAAATAGAAGNFVIGHDTLRAWVTNPAVVLNLKAEDSDAKILANPRIRVRNREKAKVHIGDRVPVITTTSTANVGVSSSVSYLDVGLKLDIEPNIYLRDEVAIKIGLEVSSISRTLDVQGTRAYELGTRNTATTLQLRDGETQILAGLISDEDRRSSIKVPGLGELPIIGRLFRDQSNDRRKTEIVLLITPRIVRSLDSTQASLGDLPVGTDAAIGSAPMRIGATKPGGVSIASSGGGQVPGPRPLPNVPAPTAQVVPTLPPETQAGVIAQRGGAQPAGANADAGQAPPPAVPAGPSNLLLTAPLSARPGTDIVVSLSLPPGGQAARATADLVYDPLQLEATSGNVAAPGRVSVRVEGSAAVRFRVLMAAGRAQVRADNVTGLSETGEPVPVSAPGPVEITVGQ